MIDTDRQLPAPSASAWSIDLDHTGGPIFIVLRRSECEGRAALVKHLVDIGSVGNTIKAERMVAAASVESVAVVW